MSKAAFAASEGVSKFRFYYWCKKFGGDSVSAERDSGFTRLSVSRHDPSGCRKRLTGTRCSPDSCTGVTTPFYTNKFAYDTRVKEI